MKMRIIINGARGKMGKEVASIIRKDKYFSVCACVDVKNESGFKNIFDVKTIADAIIDFSSHDAVPYLCAYAVSHRTPLLIFSTGHTPEEKEVIRRTSEKIPVFIAANLSLGLIMCAEFAKNCALCYPDGQIDIIEKHHAEKKDIPSGSALMAAENILHSRNAGEVIYRNNQKYPRGKNDIVIHSVRSGKIKGIHKFIITDGDETITIKHEVHERTVYAKGALQAAKFIVKKQNGLYSMNDIITNREVIR